MLTISNIITIAIFLISQIISVFVVYNRISIKMAILENELLNAKEKLKEHEKNNNQAFYELDNAVDKIDKKIDSLITKLL